MAAEPPRLKFHYDVERRTAALATPPFLVEGPRVGNCQSASACSTSTPASISRREKNPAAMAVLKTKKLAMPQ
jgi:hypothetical protein